jgi:hypothetical protein
MELCVDQAAGMHDLIDLSDNLPRHNKASIRPPRLYNIVALRSKMVASALLRLPMPGPSCRGQSRYVQRFYSSETG